MSSMSLYGEHDPKDLKKNWRQYYPPMIPIYYMDLEELKKLFHNNLHAVNPIGLEMMLGFYEEFEYYEHAALIRDVKIKMGIFDTKVDEQISSIEDTFLNDDDDDDEQTNPFEMINPFKK